MEKISLNPKNLDPKVKSMGVTGGSLSIAGVVIWWLLNQYGAFESRVDNVEKKTIIYDADRVVMKEKMTEFCDNQKTLVTVVNDIRTSVKTIELRLTNIEKSGRRR